MEQSTELQSTALQRRGDGSWFVTGEGGNRGAGCDFGDKTGKWTP